MSVSFEHRCVRDAVFNLAIVERFITDENFIEQLSQARKFPLDPAKLVVRAGWQGRKFDESWSGIRSMAPSNFQPVRIAERSAISLWTSVAGGAVNHLLAPFGELFSRREVARYGGRELPFLGLADLIRSKETERAGDWDDIAYLEEIQDARLHAQVGSGAIAVADALVQVRSRRGFDTYLVENGYRDTAAVRAALERSTNPITLAFLLPFVPTAKVSSPVVPIEAIVEQKLRAIAPESPLHRALVEVVRRKY